jgi:3-dehydroquinate dehydratase-2
LPKRVLVIHGPNLNLLGRRQPGLYGSKTLEEIDQALKGLAQELGLELQCWQSNSEAQILERIQRADYDVLIINPAAYTHTSVALRDAVEAVGKPTIEVHLSNIYAREEFRHRSLLAPVARGQISGFGPLSYTLALKAAAELAD